MSRDEVIAANPLAEYLRGRGFDLHPTTDSSVFVTNACPIAEHRKFHRCNTIAGRQNLWHCNDCDKGGSIVDWLMFERNITAADALRILGGGRNGSTPERKIAATYDYTDEAGNLLFQTVRYEPKDFRQRRPDGKGEWLWNTRGVVRVLYNLPAVIGAQTVAVA